MGTGHDVQVPFAVQADPGRGVRVVRGMRETATRTGGLSRPPARSSVATNVGEPLAVADATSVHTMYEVDPLVAANEAPPAAWVMPIWRVVTKVGAAIRSSSAAKKVRTT